MPESRDRLRIHAKFAPENLDQAVQCYLSQGQDDLYIPKQPQLIAEIRDAVLDLLPGWFVSRRSTPDNRCKVSVRKNQPVVPADGYWLICETRFVQGLDEPVSRAVPAEHPPRSGPAVCRWSKPNDQEPGRGIPKPRERSAPVIPVYEGPALLSPDVFAVLSKSRALLAIHHSSGQTVKLILS